MKIENLKAFGILEALRGMRNPLNSWGKGDSTCECDPTDGHVTRLTLGPNDTDLCRRLCQGGQPHRKFLRQVAVTMDITAPTYWWAEMDTYKVATSRNSCSVQHKGASRDFAEGDFTFDALPGEEFEPDERYALAEDVASMLSTVNRWRQRYADTKNYTYFRLMRQFLPMGYEYRATWNGSYETLLNIHEWRRHHRLREWHVFCDAIETLPGMDVFIPRAGQGADQH